jgi:hypothetical protein
MEREATRLISPDEEYESRKKDLLSENLTSEQYEAAIREICEELNY